MGFTSEHPPMFWRARPRPPAEIFLIAAQSLVNDEGSEDETILVTLHFETTAIDGEGGAFLDTVIDVSP